MTLSCPPAALLGILYEDKERQDFIFTIYHWWQAVAIFVVYLGSSLPMKVSLSVVGGGWCQLGAGCGASFWPAGGGLPHSLLPPTGGSVQQVSPTFEKVK